MPGPSCLPRVLNGVRFPLSARADPVGRACRGVWPKLFHNSLACLEGGMALSVEVRKHEQRRSLL